jgi:hypothetical protein
MRLKWIVHAGKLDLYCCFFVLFFLREIYMLGNAGEGIPADGCMSVPLRTALEWNILD